MVGFCWRLLFRTRSVGADTIPASGPAILAANHVSALDGIVMALVTAQRSKRITRFLTAAEFFENRRFAWALRLYRQIPLHRGKQDVAALDEAIATIRGGALAGIFPEGRVNAGDPARLQRGRSGVARIALATGASVIPTGIWGTQSRWPKSGLTWRRPLRPCVALAYGSAVLTAGDVGSQEDVNAFTERVMRAIEEQVVIARRVAEGRG
jgi:1-acyl-sn-glycerol-3-phosphate acyltransferase